MHFGGNIYSLTMPGPPGELITKEKKYFSESDIKCHVLLLCDKLFVESEFQHKGNEETTKNTRKFSAKSCGFLGRNRFKKCLDKTAITWTGTYL